MFGLASIANYFGFDTEQHDVRTQLKKIYLGFALFAFLNSLLTILVDASAIVFLHLFATAYFIILAKKVTLENFIPTYIITVVFIGLVAAVCTYVLKEASAVEFYLLSMLIISLYIHLISKNDLVRKGFIFGSALCIVMLYVFIDLLVVEAIMVRFQLDYTNMRVFSLANALGAFILFAYVGATFARTCEHEFVRLTKNSETDVLTGLLNRRALLDKLALCDKNYSATHTVYSVVIGDIDFFKKLNDTYGHGFGDVVLREVSRLLQTLENKHVDVCRWGGEEFVLLFRESVESCKKKMEHIRERIENHPFYYEGEKVVVTMTFGIAVASDGKDYDDVVARADDALYSGKSLGRNRVMVYDSNTCHLRPHKNIA